MNRLMGWMPELGACIVCGTRLADAPVWYSPTSDGVTCADDRRPGSSPLTAAPSPTRCVCFAAPSPPSPRSPGPSPAAAELRRFAVDILERHLERRILSARALARA